MRHRDFFNDICNWCDIFSIKYECGLEILLKLSSAARIIDKDLCSVLGRQMVPYKLQIIDLNVVIT